MCTRRADAVVVQAELPGVSPEDVIIQYDAGRLLVWGQRREVIAPEAQALHRLEIPSGRFAFRAQLPAAVDAEAAKATLGLGILEVRLAKRAPTAPGLSGSPWRRARGDRD